ncbi:hypothetical protein KKC88_04580 [Patescibacteria group bacterium]|nr:hypothetical protein [Patescibacteria group bacterium]MBU1674007.1 hypothetical protein [Patescibacteria group bacterium]MBU1963161.1 hypothetical protein [Patescibacteria group bacterium]
MSVKFLKSFDDYCEEHTSKEDVNEAIKNPDKVTREDMGNQQSLFFLKHFSEGENEYYILACATKKEDETSVYAAFYLPPEFDSQLSKMDAIDVMVAVAEAFGLEATSGSAKSKFIHHQTYWTDNDNSIPFIEGFQPGDKKMICQTWFKKEPHGSKVRIEIHTAFCINMDIYYEWLHSIKR